ncbi:cyclic pyranopterin monophosphate synthase MoaC [Aureimonas jatrophae]|uniref:Cyclic pyranopterin monophosphate synthase n=1 Tax=Aureimonas jatrophae TaxID=1166073 RepID=A0A1H0GX99_9HYPH|nr:cyclic pyranopterin monophosphate synthase MoaC [Aureimonas jatrophae]MBB3949848.1 cyclic pyranopterin phosphate synthase [Aureimonas jatrophae]SDO11525.1 cyclic pyranopterin monophosphate synthase subunit MoaC [Aureimonas jatrophae]
MSEDRLTHLDATGAAVMVDVGDKDVTVRFAKAEALVVMQPETLELIRQGNLKKGDVLATARVAGIMAAKRASELIPLCHPLMLEKVALEFDFEPALPGIRLRSEVRLSGKTGVEMEALTAVTVGALTIYDMAKAVDRTMSMTAVRVVQKGGGRSGDWTA